MILPQNQSYSLPDDLPRPGLVVVRALGYLAALVFCLAGWFFIGWAAGHAVGWVGQ
jgi:hypothetical protein